MDKTVRDPAFKTIKGFMTKLERVSDDPALKEQFGNDFIYGLLWSYFNNIVNSFQNPMS